MPKKVIWLLLSAALLVTACHKSEKDKLCKTWKVTKVDFEKADKNTEGEDSLTAGGEDLMKEVMESMFSSVTYELHPDDSCYIYYNSTLTKGHWQWQNGGKELLIVNYTAAEKDKNNKPTPFIIEHLDDTSMGLTMKSDQSSYHIRLRLSAE